MIQRYESRNIKKMTISLQLSGSEISGIRSYTVPIRGILETIHTMVTGKPIAI